MDNNIESVPTNVNKYKNNSRIICITLMIIAIILIALGVVFMLKKNNNDYPEIIVYVNNDNDLKYISTDSNKPIMLSKSFEEKLNVKFNSQRTKLAYVKNRGLYLNKINTGYESEKIGIDVDSFAFVDQDNVIYIDVDKNLYLSSSSNDKTRIDIDVTKIISINEKNIIYNKGEEVYLYNIKTKEKNSVLKDYDADKKIYVSKDNEKILYVSMDKAVKIYDIEKNNSTTKIEDVHDIVDYSNDFSNIIYTKLGDKKKYYDLFINDNPKDNPIIKYQCKFHSLDEYLNNTSIKTSDIEKNIYHLYEDIDFYIYYDENGEWHEVTMELYNYCKGADPSAKLKDEIRKDDSMVQLYNLYSSDGNVEISKNIYELIAYEDGMYVYTKFDISNQNKIKISSISSVDEVKDLINQVKPTLYFSNKEKQDELLVDGLNTKYKDDINIVNGIIYFYEVNDKKEITLYEYDTSTANKEKLTSKGFILNTNVMGYNILYLDNYNTETFKGDLIGRVNSTNTNIDIDVYSVIENDNDKLYYYKDFDFKKMNGSFIINNVKEGKKETINDISVVLQKTQNEYYILRDYSTTSQTFSLFLYENGKQTPVEYNVKDYIYSN